MARKKSSGFKKAVVMILFLAVVITLTLWATGQISLSAIGLGTVQEVFSKEWWTEGDQEAPPKENQLMVEVTGNEILLNGEAVTLETVGEKLGEVADKTVMLIDKEAKHATWSEVKRILEEKGCIIQERGE